MATFDIIILIIFFGFVGAGFYFGLVHTLGAILGLVVGVITASSLAPEVAPFFRFFMLKASVARVLAFVVVFLLVSRLIGYIIHTMDKAFKLARFIPFASMVNRLAGGLLGFCEAALAIGVVLFVVSNANISPEINQAIDSSRFASLLITIAGVLTPLVPESFKVNVNEITYHFL